MTTPRSRLAAVVAATVVLAGCAPFSADEPPASTSTADDPVVHSTEVPALHPSVDDYDETTLRIETQGGAAHLLAVKVARTPEEQQHGLMEVPSLPDGTGMWFVFGADRDCGFWMFQTLVPLSIAYVAADGTIVAVLDMEPCPPEVGDDCPGYEPGATYRTTLEVPQGWFADQGIDVGDRIVDVGA